MIFDENLKLYVAGYLPNFFEKRQFFKVFLYNSEYGMYYSHTAIAEMLSHFYANGTLEL